MAGKIKVLILGIGQSNFLDQLYGDILEKDDGFIFHIDSYRDITNQGRKADNRIYEKVISLRSVNPNKYELILAFISFLFSRLFWKVLLFELSQKSSFRRIKNVLMEFVLAKFRSQRFISKQNYDIVHFHYCISQNLREILFINKRVKKICTFWGSDLLRHTGESHKFYVRQALEEASAITVQTKELKNIILEKYEGGFSHKINALLFNLELKIFDRIDAYRNQELLIKEFKAKYDIPYGKLVFALGHNALKENNHISMISEIAKLENHILDRACFILHLSYGREELYLEELKNIAEEHPQIDFVFINEYFDASDVALLRLSTDVLIQMPVSDALSAAMTEVLYAGNRVIAASWLPYGFFMENNIVFNKIGSFEELSKEIKYIFESSVTTEDLKNKEAIKNTFFPDVTTPRWISLFKDLTP